MNGFFTPVSFVQCSVSCGLDRIFDTNKISGHISADVDNCIDRANKKPACLIHLFFTYRDHIYNVKCVANALILCILNWEFK